MIIHSFDLDMVPGGKKAEVRLNQYDEDFQLAVHLYSRQDSLTVQSGTTAAIRGTKPDGNGISVDATVDATNKVVYVTGDVQMTAVAGTGIYELTLYYNDKELNTANFYMIVERAALDKDTVASDSVVRELVNVIDNSDAIIAAGQQCEDAQTAIAALTARAETAADNAEDSADEALAQKNAAIVYIETQESIINKTIEDANEEIDEKAAEIVAINSQANTKATQALTAANNAENAAAEAQNAISTLRSALSTMQLELANKIDDAYVENGYLYLTGDGEVIAGPLGPFSGSGGGGSSGNNAVLSVTNNSGWLSKTISDSGEAVASLSWSSIEDEMPTGDGTLKIAVNGTVKAMLNIEQGNVSVDLADYCSTGSNVVRVTVSDVYGNSRTISFSVTVVSISISSSFDDTQAYEGAFVLPYTPVGEVAKTVYFKVDGNTIGTESTSVSGRQMSYTIPAQSHGAHSLEVYFECTINGETVESNHLYYEVTCVVALNNTPIVASSYNNTTAVQFATVNIPYRVYTPNSLTSDVTISVNGTQVASLTVDRTEQTFSYRLDDAGTIPIVIASGGVSKTLTLTVSESSIDVEAETQNLVLYMNAIGRSNSEANPGTWEDTDNSISATMTGFNFVSDGWQLDEDGVTVLRVRGDARVTIPYMPFQNDFRSTGKTIEIEFATSEVIDYDATVLSCLSGGRGLYMTAQKATLTSEQSTISMQYKEDEHVRLAFVVEKRSEDRLMYVYVNGVMSGVVQYPADDDFQQTTPVGLSIGSSSCTTDIYCIRVYDNNLNNQQIVENWIADTQNVDDMLARYSRNNIYDAYGNVSIGKLPATLPYMIITCVELPQYKGDKKTCTVTYVDPVTPSKSFTAINVQIDVQGTSSQYYARKNYKMKYQSGITYTQSGSTAETFPLRTGGISTDAFCMKADVASSEGANNVELAILYNDTCIYQTPPQEENSAIRQGIDGFPCVIFWSDGTDTTFLCKYNFNNDKGTEEVFGFESGDESWEIKDNTSARALWKSADFSDSSWQNDFEGRYPDKNTDTTNLAALAAWLVSTDRTAATGDALEESYTDVDGTVHTVDNAAYRLAKFKTEIGDHFELDSCLFYYVFTEVFLMVDSRAKNAFPSFLGGDKWCWLPYDFDTALGTNNVGALVFSYNLEDTDTISGDDVFNGQQSVMWTNLRDAFGSEIQTLYQTLRSNGALSYSKVEEMFETHQAAWGESIFNEDAKFKYIDPLVDDGDGSYLTMAQGSKAEQRKWWLYNRFKYMDSKYLAGDAAQDSITIRPYAAADITVTPYADIYATVKWDEHITTQRATRNTAVTLTCPYQSMNDNVVNIYSASQLSSVGDLSALKLGFANFSYGTKLTTIKIGDSSASYSNPSLYSLTLGNNTLLRTLDVRNCTGLGDTSLDGHTQTTVDLSGCTNIEYVYFDGTKVTGVTLPNGGILKTLHLPATVTNLTVRNQTAITDFVLPAYAQITSLWLENVSDAIDGLTILNAIASGSRVRLINVAWEAEDASEIIDILDQLDLMRGLDEYGGNVNTAQISGTIHTTSLTAEESTEIAGRLEDYPYLTVDADYTSATLTYKSYDGSTTLKTVTCLNGVPQESAPSGPSRSASAQYTYTFVGWNTAQDQQSATADYDQDVTVDRTVYAAYSRTVNTYTITWKNSDGTTLETDTGVAYGATPTYNGSTPQNPDSSGGSFQGWSPSVTTVTGNATYTATYVVTYTVYFYNGTTLLQTVTGVTAGGTATYTGSTPVDPDGGTFTGWSPSNMNITANTSCYAQFSSVAVPTATTADGAYGVEWDYSSSATTLTRKGLAASFSDPTPATSVSGTGSSPFDSIAPWCNMKRYCYVNGSWVDSTDGSYDETQYDTMVYIPEFYYTAYKDTTNSKWLWAISPTQLTGYVKHPGSGRYVSAFHTSGSSSLVSSLSGVTPLVSISCTNFRTYSHNKGSNWYMLDIASWSALQMLYLVEFANFHSQSTLGTGYNVGSKGSVGGTTGATYHTVKVSGGHNMYRWIEDPFSNVMDWVDGFIAVNRAVYTGVANANFADSSSVLTSTGITLPSSNFISGFGYSENAPYAFIPDTAAGSSSTYVPDKVFSSSGTMALYVGGFYGSSDYYGVFCFDASSSATNTYASLGSRLLYIP